MMGGDAPAIVIAAGGDGSRMGGSKPQRLLAGRRLIDHAANWARQRSDSIALAVRSVDDDLGTGLPILIDREAGIGPISALASAIRFARDHGRNQVVMIGCDMPFLPDDLVSRLRSTLADHGAAMPVSNGRLHPMASLWKADESAIDAYMAKGGQSLWRFAETVGMVRVEWTEALNPFANINDPRSLTEAEELLRRRGG